MRSIIDSQSITVTTLQPSFVVRLLRKEHLLIDEWINDVWAAVSEEVSQLRSIEGSEC